MVWTLDVLSIALQEGDGLTLYGDKAAWILLAHPSQGSQVK